MLRKNQLTFAELPGELARAVSGRVDIENETRNASRDDSSASQTRSSQDTEKALASAQAHIAVLEKTLKDKEALITTLHERARQQSKRTQLLRALCGELRTRVDALDRENKALAIQNEALLTSTIWRLTMPLRTVIIASRKFTDLVLRRKQGVPEKEKQPEEQQQNYDRWVESNGTLTDTDREAIRGHISQLPLCPKISVLMPVYDPEERWLVTAIESVHNQLYPHWELCIADDASSKAFVRSVLERYQGADKRIKVVFRQQNGHISAASNSALSLASGEFLALLDHDDVLSEQALYRVAVEFNDHPDAGLIYSDEDKIDENGRRYDPYFKPDWNPELLLGQNMVSHLGAYKTAIVRDVGGFREGYEGSQDWDLALRVTDKIASDQIRHIPDVLYHWRAVSGSTALQVNKKTYAAEAARRGLESHFIRTKQPDVEILPIAVSGMWRILYPTPHPAPKVSLIIPTRNGYELLRLCVESIVEKTDYPNYELIIVDNQSDDPQILEYFEELAERPHARLLHYDAPFNFSAINNFAVERSDGEILGFLNNDLEVISSDWLDEMVSHAVRPHCGAVGAMLYYPDGRVQHAGAIVGAGGVVEGYRRGIARHAYTGRERGYPGQMNRARLTQNLSAVTAACLVVRRNVFEAVGGFDDDSLKVAFNDIDLCLRIQENGYRNVWTPFAELYHHESATRGYEDTLEKRDRFRGECKIMMERWGDLLGADPAYNPNLDLATADFHWSLQSRASRPWL